MTLRLAGCSGEAVAEAVTNPLLHGSGFAIAEARLVLVGAQPTVIGLSRNSNVLISRISGNSEAGCLSRSSLHIV
jgi:hypothetical protein